MSGLPNSGTLYVHHTYTPLAGWGNQTYTYTMNVGSGGGSNTGGGDAGNPTLRWDRTLNAGNGDAEGCNSDRFKCVLPTAANPTGEAVLDLETGLVWDRRSDLTPRTWAAAIDHCASRNVGGRFGWSLPMREQLARLLDPTGVLLDNLPIGHPFVVNPSSLWSTTTHAAFVTHAWFVDFFHGTLSINLKTNSNFNVLCVRGGQTFDGNTHNTLP